MIRLRAKEYTYIKMDLHTQASGKMTNKMALELKSGLMDLNTKDILEMA